MFHNMVGLPIDILLIEDNPGDVRLTREAFKLAKMKNNLHVAADGSEALDFLFKKGPYENTPNPDLILLDLNLPKIDGRQLLQEIKKDKQLRTIPVIVLTTSTAEEDILQTYHLHANCYISKPMEMDEFVTVVKTIENFWLSIVKLPNSDD